MGTMYYYPTFYATSSSAPSFSIHTTVTIPESTTLESTYYVLISVNEYTLTLNGKGGTFNGEDHVSMTNEYPTQYSLSDHIFERESYVQVGWATAFDLLPLNTLVTPESDMALEAVWLEVEDGDIVLNGLGGILDSAGNTYMKSDSSVALPSSLTCDGASLLAWCSEVLPNADQNSHLYSGQWYAGGDTVDPNLADTTLLYAQYEGSGQYAVYHLDGGTAVNGGTLLVQGTHATAPNLTVYTPDESAFSAPDCHEFAGWYDPISGETLPAGAELQLTTSATTHLYAKWVRTEYEHITSDGITVTYNLEDSTVHVTVPNSVCVDNNVSLGFAALYSGSGQMLSCNIAEYRSDESLILDLSYNGPEVPLCRVFLVNSSYTPCGRIEFDPSES